jgi:hypothetical protein
VTFFGETTRSKRKYEPKDLFVVGEGFFFGWSRVGINVVRQLVSMGHIYSKFENRTRALCPCSGLVHTGLNFHQSRGDYIVQQRKLDSGIEYKKLGVEI